MHLDRETRIDVSFRNPHLIYHRLQLIADHDANFDVEDYGADFDAEDFEYIISDEELIAEIELEQSNTRCNNDDDCNSGFECSSGRPRLPRQLHKKQVWPSPRRQEGRALRCKGKTPMPRDLRPCPLLLPRLPVGMR